MPHSKLFTHLEALFAVVVWGASFIATKFGCNELPSGSRYSLVGETDHAAWMEPALNQRNRLKTR